MPCSRRAGFIPTNRDVHLAGLHLVLVHVAALSAGARKSGPLRGNLHRAASICLAPGLDLRSRRLWGTGRRAESPSLQTLRYMPPAVIVRGADTRSFCPFFSFASLRRSLRSRSSATVRPLRFAIE